MTIFDFDPTDAEIASLFGERRIAEEACGEQSDHDSQVAAIASLMALRGKDADAERFVRLIKDPQYRFDTRYSFLQTA